MPDTTEKRFEMDIVDYLLSPAGGYTEESVLSVKRGKK